MTGSRQQSCRTSPEKIPTAPPNPHTPIGGGGGAVGLPNLPNLCRTSGAAGGAKSLQMMVPLATFLKVRSQLQAERALRILAERERDQLREGWAATNEGQR
jgi:hypothetical protein